jgi:peptide-methionine (S)-S-oxide reductase
MRLLGWIGLVALTGLFAVTGCAEAKAFDGDPALKPIAGVGTHPGGIGTPNYRGMFVPKGHDQIAMFAMGCFWGSEATFRKVKGVVATAVGFSGGITPNPSYELVCTGRTHHAETVAVEFDPSVVTYAQLLEVFWASHDPTTLNQQGPDVGEQYRSEIFYFTPEQRDLAITTGRKEQALIGEKIVTKVAPAGAFYLAEGYHQQYDEKTGRDTCPPARRQVRGVKMGG